ncbi:15-hydroxyprostaglandin dehydrogenase [NAD(+)] [Cynoglossus semilaevis]|uniref:15-hydroxyprostaglandin dehydrogenase [NAD(+)] n=1 Tax=Cynoglossus semilaevis TaxID=244447 RepID=A0A3P8WNN7_CYNSE|nr:15-hydroxyprostaglandin dehydrogenase [NAD(+)]-like [Cynoglossus semilaevis]
MALSGKIAVVTGAAMGIGKAITEKLLQNSAKVALLDINEDAATSFMEALQKKYGPKNTLFQKCNVESEEEVKAAFKKTVETFGGIDILCNNAGILNESTWEKMVSINLVSVIRVTYLALEHMNKLAGGRGGVIVNTSSLAGLGPLPSCPAYTATKHGVIGFTRATASAFELSGYGIRVNAICPAFVQTDLFTNIPERLGQLSHLQEVSQHIVNQYGVMDVSKVADDFYEMLTDETKNGEALMITGKERIYIPFPQMSTFFESG